MSETIFIRLSGLGGQGVVTASHIIGAAAYRDNWQVTVNPFFGAEKRLAPAESYVRISSEPIFERGEVLYPHIIMIFHPHVITLGKCYTMPFFHGLQEGGTILINSPSVIDLSQEDQEDLAALKARIHYVPATHIAMQVGGTELATNIAMIGGLYGIRPLTSEQALLDAMLERFGGKFIASATTAALDDAVKERYGKVSQMIERNMEVFRKARESLFQHSVAQEGLEPVLYTAKVIEEKCRGCKLCILSCPDPNVITFCSDNKMVSIDEERCKGCGLCVSVCPTDALYLG